MLSDLKLAFRQLVKSPGFTIVALLTLALGIGANTALFSLMDQLLYRPLPVPEPERLVELAAVGSDDRTFTADFNFPLFRDYQRGNTVFEALSATSILPVGVGADSGTDRRQALLVSGNYFSMLRVEPALGRAFAPGEGVTVDDAPVVVLSHGLWVSQFGADPLVLGRKVTVNGHPFTVIGVAPREFAGTSRGRVPDLYVPITMLGLLTADRPGGEHPLNSRYFTWHHILGRLKDGITREQAQLTMDVLNAEIHRATPPNTPEKLALLPGGRGDTQSVAEARRPLQLLLAMAGLVLLIACANLSTLQLARASGRAREFAVRIALGAGRGRLLRALLAESLLLSTLGGALGMLGSVWLVTLLQRYELPNQPFVLAGTIDLRVLAFTSGVAMLTGMVFGLAPAWQASRAEPMHDLKSAGASEARSPHQKLRHALIVVQVALSLIVLVCAGLFSGSLRQLQRLDAGFEPSGVVLASFDLELNRAGPAQSAAFYAHLLERARTLPGVEAASLSKLTPLDGNTSGWSIDRIEGYEPGPGERPWSRANFVSPDYFRALGIAIVHGRDFNAADSATSPRVAIVDETFARTYRGGELSVGWRIYLPPAQGKGPAEPVEVVGIVRRVHGRSLGETPERVAYCPVAQSPSSRLTLAVRTGLPPSLAVAGIRALVKSLDPAVPVFQIRTLEQQLSSSLALQRLAVTLLDGFGLLTLSLVAVGLYGMIAYSVSRRTREFGIRLALGAQLGEIRRLVLRQGIRLVALGIVLGVGGALAVARLARNQLFGVGPVDPGIFVGVIVLLFATAALACWLPARRATKVDPLVALRAE
jgi:predicted permease